MMAQRKDMMRIIRQDAGFSAKLGFGGAAGNGAPVERSSNLPMTSVEADEGATPETSVIEKAISAIGLDHDGDGRRAEAQEEARKEEDSTRAPIELPMRSEGGVVGPAGRGQVVYVAVSLTSRQARLAEAWASAARCTVQFLIRRVAQGLRDQVFDDWERNGMPEVDESRGTRGKHPTSVTLTLRPQFAADLAAQHDPLGILGLARVMGPAYRARFQKAFDDALAKAKFQTTNEGDEQ